MSFLIAIPTGIKFFKLTGTMWRGQLTFEAPMLFTIGFLVTFLFGGLTGVILASPPLDFHVSDTYFLVAHFHYVLFGTVVFTMFGGFYFLVAQVHRKKLGETLGTLTLFTGFWMTFLGQHWEGVQGMPRRVATTPTSRQHHHAETRSPASAPSSSASPRFSSSTTCTRPGGPGSRSPWTTPGVCELTRMGHVLPPPRHNFTKIPRIRLRRPAFNLHHPGIQSGGPDTRDSLLVRSS